MTDRQPRERIKISSIVITDRTRKDLGDITSLAESIRSVGLMQPIVINEKNQLIDGQRRIEAFVQLRKTEIPFYQVNLEQIFLGEFHSNSNRKDFTPSERITISNAIEEYFEEHSRGVGRPRSHTTKSSKVSAANSALTKENERIPNLKSSKNNVVKLTTFSSSPLSSTNFKLTGRVKDNIANYLGVSRNTLEKEKKIIEAAERAPEQFGELRKKVDVGKISTDKAFNELQKQVKRNQLIDSARNSASDSHLQNGITLLHGDFREHILGIPDSSVDLIFTDPPYSKDCLPIYHDLAVASSKVLKNGGSLVTYANHCLVPEITKITEASTCRWARCWSCRAW